MSDLRNFTWNSLHSELSLKAPSYLAIHFTIMHIFVKATSKPKCCDWHVLNSALETQILKNVHCAKSYTRFGFWRLQKIGIHDAHFIGFFFIHGCFTLGISAPTKSESKFVA